MTSPETPTLETLCERLCEEVQPIFESVPIFGCKWITTPDGTLRVVVPDVPLVRSFSFSRALDRLREVPSFDSLKKHLRADPVFASLDAGDDDATRARFTGIVQGAMARRAEVVGQGVRFDASRVAAELERLKAFLSGHVTLNSEVNARVWGIVIEEERIRLPDGMSLVRLDDEEMNIRQSFIPEHDPFQFEESRRLEHRAEIRYSVPYLVDDYRTPALWSERGREAQERCPAVLEALMLCTSGSLELGPIEVSNPFGGMQCFVLSHGPIPAASVRIGSGDEECLKRAYSIVKQGLSDAVMRRAVRRFLLGRDRLDWRDAIVDYVVAFESLVLTVNGHPVIDELSYRFSINATLLLREAGVGREEQSIQRQMKALYRCRSAIVHGGDSGSIESNLRNVGFGTIGEARQFLEVAFRQALFWLDTRMAEERPYRSAGGWDDLLWR